MIKVLFTGGGGAGSEALFRLLGQHYVLHFGDADVSAIDPSIPEDRRHQLPWASDPDFVVKMLGICARLDIDLLVPGVDEELLALAQRVGEFGSTRLLLPHESYVATMLDKLHMVKALLAQGIPVPSSQTLADDLQGIRFPCISKPRSGRGSRDVRVLETMEDATSLKSSLGPLAEKMLIQEKVEGVEYTVQMVADSRGCLHAVVPVKVGVKRGITLRAETEADSRVMSACSAIHRAIPTRGCYNIQLMLSPEGQVLPFEINPRVSTTLCLVVAAGVDPISVFFEDDERRDFLPFATGLQLRRHWTNYFFEGQKHEIQYS